MRRAADGITRGLQREVGAARMFDTLLEEQTVLGLSLGAEVSGLLPIPEIQYLAHLYNAEDQLRDEAATFQFFSPGHYRNTLTGRIAGDGYQTRMSAAAGLDESVQGKAERWSWTYLLSLTSVIRLWLISRRTNRCPDVAPSVGDGRRVTIPFTRVGPLRRRDPRGRRRPAWPARSPRRRFSSREVTRVGSADAQHAKGLA